MLMHPQKKKKREKVIQRKKKKGEKEMSFISDILLSYILS